VFSQSNVPMRCRRFESRLEDYLGGAPDSELKAHLAWCAHCRRALENSRDAGDLLREVWEPAGEPSRAFLANVMARIQREEVRATARAAFWTPLESLASRLSLTAAMVLLALSSYLVKFPPGLSAPAAAARNELLTSPFPQPPVDPVSNEEVLLSLAEREYGR
jgi:hypothetical protein